MANVIKDGAAAGPAAEENRGKKMGKIEKFVAVVAALALVGFVAFLLVGCDQAKAAKERLATLTCAKHGGYKSYKPKLDHLEVLCQDGAVVSVKWLP